MRSLGLVPAVLVLAALGCSDGGGGVPDPDAADGGPIDGPPADLGPASPVRGSWINRGGVGADVVALPVDLTAGTVRVWLQEPGGARSIPGAGDAAGMFEIPGVPAGPFVLEVRLSVTAAPRLLASTGSLRSFDLGSDVFSHPSSPGLARASAGTAVAFELASPAPWRTGDLFHVLYEVGLQYLTSIPPQPGTPIRLLVPHEGTRHMDGPGLGHRAYVVHKGDTWLPNGHRLSAPRATAITTAVKTVQGQMVTVPVVLAAPPMGARRAFDVRRSEYLSFRPTAGPAAGAPKVRIGFHRLPQGLSLRAWGLSELAELEVPAGLEDVAGDLPLPEFLPADWREMRQIEVAFPTPCWLPGAMRPLVNEAVMRTLEEGAASPGPARPLLGPPEDVTLSGRPAQQNLAGVGLSPTIRWTAPRLGEPTNYRVILRRLEARLDEVVEVSQSTMPTDVPQVTLPPGVLEPGHWYRAEIRAEQRPMAALGSPWRDVLPVRESATFTGAFTP